MQRPQPPQRLRAAWRLARAAAHALAGLWVVLLWLPRMNAAQRQARIAAWSRGLLRSLGVGLSIEGEFRPGAKLIVANHVSWLDIMAIHAVCPQARFVSKADVQRWPLISRLVDAAHTLYVVREKPRDAMRVLHQMSQALSAGDTVAVFPEGTTGLGDVPLPFHANLLQAAIAAQVPVQPVALRFSDARHDISPAADFRGEITLAQSLWSLACGEGVCARVSVLEAQAVRHADRRALSAHLRTLIGNALQQMPPLATGRVALQALSADEAATQGKAA